MTIPFQYAPNSFDARTIAIQRNDQFAVYGLAVRNHSSADCPEYVVGGRTIDEQVPFSGRDDELREG